MIRTEHGSRRLVERLVSRRRGHAMVVAMAFSLGACSSGPSPEQQALSDMQWGYAEDAIELQLSASNDLNQSDGQAHTLLLVVTQFDQPNAFATYTSNSQQLSRLLLMETPPADLIGLTRLFIEPGESRQVRLARLEGARFVGISAGYAHLDPQRSERLYGIGVDMTSSGWIDKRWNAAPKPLRIELLLGRDAILQSQQSQPTHPPEARPVEGELTLPGAD